VIFRQNILFLKIRLSITNSSNDINFIGKNRCSDFRILQLYKLCFYAVVATIVIEFFTLKFLG